MSDVLKPTFTPLLSERVQRAAHLVDVLETVAVSSDVRVAIHKDIRKIAQEIVDMYSTS